MSNNDAPYLIYTNDKNFVLNKSDLNGDSDTMSNNDAPYLVYTNDKNFVLNKSDLNGGSEDGIVFNDKMITIISDDPSMSGAFSQMNFNVAWWKVDNTLLLAATKNAFEQCGYVKLEIPLISGEQKSKVLIIGYNYNEENTPLVGIHEYKDDSDYTPLEPIISLDAVWKKDEYDDDWYPKGLEFEIPNIETIEEKGITNPVIIVVPDTGKYGENA